MFAEVLSFWFQEVEPRQWWITDPIFDALVARRYLDLLQQAAAGELYVWRVSPAGRLAEIILLDQFSRNIHRGTTQAFTQDPMALALAQEAVCGGALAALEAVEERNFLLMPYMHSESSLIHVQAETLFKEHGSAESYQFELRHKAIIDRFARYPHRNALLGRVSTAAELEFLKQPGSSF